MTKKGKDIDYTKYIDVIEEDTELVTDDHDKIIKTLMYVYVLHYIKQRKLRDKIDDNSKDDAFKTDIYDFLDDYVLPIDHENKRKGQINVDKHIIKKKVSKPKPVKSKPKKPSNNPTKPKPLKSPINIQSNWIFNMQYFELALVKELLPVIKAKTGPSELKKMSEKKIPIYKFMYYVTEKTLQIDDTKADTETDEELNFIDDQVDKLTKVYKSVLPEKNNGDLDIHLAEMISNFIKVLAFYAEVSIWHSTPSKSCNQTHFITAIDTFRRQTNIPVPFDLLKFSIMYGQEKTKKKSDEDKIRDQKKSIEKEEEKLRALIEKTEKEKKRRDQETQSEDDESNDESNDEDAPDYP